MLEESIVEKELELELKEAGHAAKRTMFRERMRAMYMKRRHQNPGAGTG
jgi:hypothetical protein